MSMPTKTGGADRELGAAILGRGNNASRLTCFEAARRIMREFDGWPRASSISEGRYGNWFGIRRDNAAHSMDSAGKFLTNGGCAYIDLGHPEICTPECRSALQYAACMQAMLSRVQDAVRAANARLPEAEEIVVQVDNSDRQGNSYGAHLNVTLSRKLWHEIFRLRIHPHLHFLASFKASSIVITGGGKVGSEDGAPAADFQLSRRADFMKVLVAEQTTYDRPMVNSRDEAHGTEARLHDIFFDATMFPAANYLQFGCLQLVTAMMESGSQWMPSSLLLAEPLVALHTWSRDPGLTATAELVDGRRVTALEHQSLLVDHITRYLETGACEHAVSDAAGIVAYWRETVELLQRGDEDRAARRIEWLARHRILQAAIERRPSLDWHSPGIRQLDLCFGDLDPERGVFWALQDSGAVDALFTPEQVARFKHAPPDDTRAHARVKLLWAFGEHRVEAVDWSEIRIRHEGRRYRLDLPDPGEPTVDVDSLALELIERSTSDRVEPHH